MGRRQSGGTAPESDAPRSPAPAPTSDADEDLPFPAAALTTGAATSRDIQNGSRSWLAGWVFGALVLAAVVTVVLRFTDFAEFLSILRAARPGWLVLAGLAQVATYICAAAVWHQVLDSAGYRRSLASLIPLGLVKLFTDQAVPTGGMSGAILLLRGLARRAIPDRVAMAALLVDMVSYYAAYLSIVLIGVGVLWLRHQANTAVLTGAAIFVVVMIAVPGAVLWLRRLGRTSLPGWLARFPKLASLAQAVVEAPSDLLRDRGLLARTTGLQLGVFLLDSLTLWLAFRALGSAPDFSVAFVGFAIASAAATIGPIPLGLGTFEAACVAILHLLGVSLGRGLAATLLLRFLTFWLPMLPGLWLTRRELR
jgi:uncharacterized membrane protein YbhN (UPF0104 family)